MGFSLGEWGVMSSEPSVSVVIVTKDSLAQSSRSMSAGCVFECLLDVCLTGITIPESRGDLCKSHG